MRIRRWTQSRETEESRGERFDFPLHPGRGILARMGSTDWGRDLPCKAPITFVRVRVYMSIIGIWLCTQIRVWSISVYMVISLNTGVEPVSTIEMSRVCIYRYACTHVPISMHSCLEQNVDVHVWMWKCVYEWWRICLCYCVCLCVSLRSCVRVCITVCLYVCLCTMVLLLWQMITVRHLYWYLQWRLRIYFLDFFNVFLVDEVNICI